MKPQPSASAHLLALAHKAARIYTANPKAQAMLVAGSTASGESDSYSDLDMMVYYGELPSEEELEAARKANGGAERLWLSGKPEEGAFAEAYMTGGIQQQIVHSTLQAWEKTMNQVLLDLDMTPTLQKALMGMQHGLALYGEARIQAWKDRLEDYPKALATKMVQHHLQFFPLWGYAGYFAGRDALIWHYQTLVEAAHNLLGVLAGLNRVYYSTFQFKRMRKFVDTLALKPPRLCERLEALFSAERVQAGLELRELVRELLDLVEEHMPEADTARLRGRLDWQAKPWAIDS